ncbi:MAG: ABC transporter substrate-binding protein [Desulfobacteraceae bacterium]|nr:ABC transporter substrate-binding protein [Desulfobacteraceae bacterium]
MKKILAILLPAIVLSAAASYAAKDTNSAKILLEDKISSVIKVLEQEDLTDSEKRSKIESIVDPVFNYQLMAKLALGPEHWPKLSRDQKEIFSQRFIKRLKDSYFDKISMYSADQNADFTYGTPAESNGKARVPVTVRAGGEKIEMIYKFYRSGDDWKVYDVEVGGVSIIRSYRSQFDEVLSDGTVEQLLEELKSTE